MMNELEEYNKITKELAFKAGQLNIPTTGKYSLPEIVIALRESFKYKSTFYKIFNTNLYTKSDIPAKGYCLTSACYIFIKTGMYDHWNIMKRRDPKHWWLEEKITSKPFCITYDQFKEPFNFNIKEPELFFGRDEKFTEKFLERALILGKCAGLE